MVSHALKHSTHYCANLTPLSILVDDDKRININRFIFGTPGIHAGAWCHCSYKSRPLIDAGGSETHAGGVYYKFYGI